MPNLFPCTAVPLAARREERSSVGCAADRADRSPRRVSRSPHRTRENASPPNQCRARERSHRRNFRLSTTSGSTPTSTTQRHARASRSCHAPAFRLPRHHHVGALPNHTVSPEGGGSVGLTAASETDPPPSGETAPGQAIRGGRGIHTRRPWFVAAAKLEKRR